MPSVLVGESHWPTAEPVSPKRLESTNSAGLPSRPMVLTVRSYDSTSRSTAAAVRTLWPPPVPTTYAE